MRIAPSDPGNRGSVDYVESLRTAHAELEVERGVFSLTHAARSYTVIEGAVIFGNPGIDFRVAPRARRRERSRVT